MLVVLVVLVVLDLVFGFYPLFTPYYFDLLYIFILNLSMIMNYNERKYTNRQSH